MPDGNPKILIVDDAPENLEVLVAILHPMYKVRAVTSGEYALRDIKVNGSPDLIILDVMMPVMDGFAVLRALKADPVSRDISVILLTALADKVNEEHGFFLGAVDYITKPVNRTVFLARVRTHLALKQARDKLAKQGREAELMSAASQNVLAVMSHEIRNPMNGVLAMADMLARSGLDAHQKEMVEVICSSSDSLLSILDDVLEFSKLQNQRVKIRHEMFDLVVLFESVLEVFSRRAFDKRVELILNVGVAVPQQVCADEHRLRQVLINLVSNAVKYTKGGYVYVSVEMVPGDQGSNTDLLHIEVKDTGPGINPERAANLFKPYERADDVEEWNREGSGLGLSICLQLLDLMDGSIGVTSKPEQGTTFWVKLPVVKEIERVVTPHDLLKEYNIITRGFHELAGAAIGNIVTDQHGCISGRDLSKEGLIAYAKTMHAKNPKPVLIACLDDPAEMKRLESELTEVPELKVILAVPFFTIDRFRDKCRKDTWAIVGRPIRRAKLISAITGSELSESLPQGRESKVSEQKWSAPDWQIARASRAVVLAVDDNANNRRVLNHLFVRAGVRGIVVATATEALETLTSESGIGLLISDYHMPEMDGIGLLRVLRRGEGIEKSDLPVVILTADVMPKTRRKLMIEGATAVLEKPVRFGEFCNMLQRVIPNVLKLRELLGTVARGCEESHTFDDSCPIDKAVLRETLGVDSESGIAEAIEFFYRSTVPIQEQMLDAAERNDQSQVLEVAHGLLGSASAIGAKKVCHTVRNLEWGARNLDWQTVKRMLQELERNLNELHAHCSPVNLGKAGG